MLCAAVSFLNSLTKVKIADYVVSFPHPRSFIVDGKLLTESLKDSKQSQLATEIDLESDG